MPPLLNPPPAVAGNDDENVRRDIAVRALGDMRSRASASGDGRASSRSSRNDESESTQPSSSDFVSRMSSLPLFGTAIRAYEHGKASSRVVKYGAQMVESSVKTISKPVINRLPVNQLDEFACRQLDKFDRYRRPSVGPDASSPRSPVSPSQPPTQRISGDSLSSSPTNRDDERGRPKLRTKTLDGSIEDMSREKDRYQQDVEQVYEGSDRSVPKWIQSTNSYNRSHETSTLSPKSESSTEQLPQVQKVSSRPSVPSSPYPRDAQSRFRRDESRDSQQTQTSTTNPERQVAQRSRWQAMLLEAGGLGVALSDENMRRLKYCLQWLQSATAHIDAQILILRDFMEAIQPNPQPNTNAQRRPPISEEHLQKLTEVRKDIVVTVRQMVDVVSKYAGGALPEPARGKVRGFILNLPQRWASRAGGASGLSGPVGGERERESGTVAAAGSSTGVLRRGQGRDKRAAHRERGTTSRATSPAPDSHHHGHSHSHSHSHSYSGSAPPQLSRSNATAAAQRILTLATESLDMMRNVTGVVKDSLDRADAWVNRLRMVGVNRVSQDNVDEATLNEELGLAQTSSHESGQRVRTREEYHILFQKHRRGVSTSSTLAEDEASFSGSIPPSPLTAATSLSFGNGYQSSTYTAASSMPSTPTGGSFASPSMSSRDIYGTATNAPSPVVIPLSSMHINSRYNTPKLGVIGLPPLDDDRVMIRKEQSMRMEVDS